MILWLLALPRFLIICCVSGIGSVISLVVPAVTCLLILCELSEVQITKCAITFSVCILEGTDTGASGIRGYFPQMLKY